MQYVSFEVCNYRGIERARIELPQGKGSRVTTLIGLNESGKTTLLEAIYSFSPDPESKALYEDSTLLSDDPAYYIPRGEFSNFNGDITVKAVVRWDDDEIDDVAREIRNAHGLTLDTSALTPTFEIVSNRQYQASSLIKKETLWYLPFRVKSGRQQTFRESSAEQKKVIFSVLLRHLPNIAYFPTFLFNFPNKIFLTGGSNKPIDRFYRKIFQAVLEAGGEGHTIEKHIVGRYEDIHRSGALGKMAEAATAFLGARSSQEMIKQTVDKAADTVSDAIISKWDQIFPHSPLRKEISVDAFEKYDGVEGAGFDEDELDVWVEFKVRDSGSRYNISDRSLGFRWFFCFLLFTKFMPSSDGKKGILFLFDEPASNLHARAQEKLLESFSEIAMPPNSLIFSTHSHYMVEPTWLERAYVVKNDAIDYSDAGGETKGKRVRIESVKYRDFVSQADSTLDRTTYFQPVLDRLDVKPSRLDVQSNCVVVEGKSDFHILAYIKRHYGKTDVPIVPAFGATTMRPLIGILRGWASKFIVLLDSDTAGQAAAAVYKDELDLSDEIVLMNEIDADADEIEDFIGQEDRERIQKELGLKATPSKKKLARIFQEANAAGTKLPLTRSTIDRLRRLLTTLSARVG